MSANVHQTVRDLALSVPGATRAFEQAGIDYCCGGGRTLEDACASAGVDAGELLATLRGLEESGQATAGDRDFVAMSLEALVDHIVQTHHVFTFQELARLDQLLAKVRAKHEGNHPELAAVGAAFGRLLGDLLPHMQKEERMLFPYVVELERAHREGRQAMRPPFVTVRNPIRMMMLEHDAAGEFLREIRTATANFVLPEGACMSYGALYEGLEGLERDLHQHIHLENNVLFPRAAALEEEA
jgi:regulator of cell morphogenesis and NO signaling